MILAIIAGNITTTAADMTQAKNNAVEGEKVASRTITPNEHKNPPKAKKQAQTDKRKTKAVDAEQLDLLARLIEQEAGADYCSDTLREYVGAVALNRVKDSRFPSTLAGVIYQEGQYYCAMVGSIEKPASERSKRIARKLLTDGSDLPADCVWQAEFEQGDGAYYTEGSTYICY